MIHQTLHSVAFAQLEALLRICGRWSPVIISTIVPLLIPPPIGKSTSWATRRTTNTKWWYWKPLSWKMRCYFAWRVNRSWPKRWSIMTIICWTLMKSEGRKIKVGYLINIRILMMQFSNLYKAMSQHIFLKTINTILHLTNAMKCITDYSSTQSSTLWQELMYSTSVWLPGSYTLLDFSTSITCCYLLSFDTPNFRLCILDFLITK